jgi:hypothetical protein
MTYCPPDRSPRFDAKSSDAPQRVAAQEEQRSGRRRGGKRGRKAITREIQRTAHERQAAWLETEQPTTTYRLTRELDGLYDEHRDEQAGTLTDPFGGRTWVAK